MAGVADRVFTLIKDTVETQNVRLWDVKFVKEGASYYLRVFIDSDAGINIDDCTNVSHAIDPIIDEADPIEQSYCLEVSSPGLERELTRESHFEVCKGEKIKVKMIRAIDGVREFSGILESSEGMSIVLRLEDGSAMNIEKKETSYIKLDDFNF